MRTKNERAAELWSSGKEKPSFLGMNVSVEGSDLLFSVNVVQRYKNPSHKNIEVVYTFPVPTEGVMLELSVRIGERMLSGEIVEKLSAEREYEKAVATGDTAVLVEETASGLYSVNLGNLMAGEAAEISFTYAIPLKWNGDQVRFCLPTTLAPRYGDPAAAGLKAHQVPEVSLVEEYPLGFSLTARGALAKGRVLSPSHNVTVSKEGEALHVALNDAEKAFLDRDLVLVFESSANISPFAQAAGEVVMASFCPRPTAEEESNPLSITLVIDCSGSMGGDSIRQARAALMAVLDELKEADFFTIIKFGSHFEELFDVKRPATKNALNVARRYANRIDADMDGTELGSALERAYAMTDEEEGLGGGTVLLITDGQIWDNGDLKRKAGEAGVRLFVVGVGTSVTEGNLRPLAEASGGAFEAVGATEDIRGVVIRQFERMRERRVKEARIIWPETPQWQTELPKVLYSGDTVHVFAGFKQPAAGEVKLAVSYVDGESFLAIAPIGRADNRFVEIVPRIAAAKRILDLSETEARALALEHRLITPYTHFLMVANLSAEERAEDLPELQKVAHMLAAGWGATARAEERNGCCMKMRRIFSSMSPEEPSFCRITRKTPHESGEVIRLRKLKEEHESCEVPTFLRSQGGDSPKDFAEELKNLLDLGILKGQLGEAELKKALALIGARSKGLFKELKTRGWAQREIVYCFYAGLLDSILATEIERNCRRVLIRYLAKKDIHPDLKSYFAQNFDAHSSDWDWLEHFDMIALPDRPGICGTPWCLSQKPEAE